jgi:ribulose-5-phosphate 4-epimerase/fuculose-1-phosphate aldolase
MSATDTLSAFERERALRKQQVANGYRLFASWGWGDDGSGHITARDPEHTDHFWLLKSPVPFWKATPDDLVLVSPDGSVAGNHAINPAAFFIHQPIHEQRPDVVGVVHTHTSYGTPFAALCEPLAMMSQEACGFTGNQSVFSGTELDVTARETGNRLATSLGRNRLLILANHGLLTVGGSVGEAIGFFVLAERAAEVQVKCPAGRRISDIDAQRVAEGIGAPENGVGVFEWLVRSRLGQPVQFTSARIELAIPG